MKCWKKEDLEAVLTSNGDCLFGGSKEYGRSNPGRSPWKEW
jgi:hypothetical protein